ncbi:iron-containing alcohol dehydrogenase [bacterium]|nr:iron-containing alcohol dehydrogenase [bacterium]
MNSFEIYTPTRILFGADQINVFAERAAQLGKHAFVVLGGGTVEKLGFLQPLAEQLANLGVKLTHFRGIEPNPEAATINRAAAQLKAVGADFVLAVGGGSVMDAAKSIAALAYTGEADIWPFVAGEARAFQLSGALPIAAVPTTAATASEVTPFAVISNREVGGKSIISHEFVKPRLAWLNPSFTQGLSATVTQDGAADIFSHVIENYLLGTDISPLADRYSEAVMSTVFETLPRLLANPHDLQARADLMWASTLALNDYQKAGRAEAEFVLHSIEHSLSAKHPELAHGRGLATLYPAYFRWLLGKDRAQARLAQLGTRLFGVKEGSPAERAERFIQLFEDWLQQNGLLQSLQDLGFNSSEFEGIAEYAVKTYGDGNQLNALGPITRSDIVEIFQRTDRQSLVSR